MELKPCPFCGSSEIFVEAWNESEGYGKKKKLWTQIKVRCGNCNANFCRRKSEDAHKELLERWNRRTDK